MKKTILSMALSASILTASPLFAMEDPNDPSEPPHKTAIKRTAPIDDNDNSEPQPKKLHERIMNDKKINGTRNFQQLPQHLTLNILEHLSISDVLKVFQLSKAMRKICNQNAVWKLLVEKHHATVYPPATIYPLFLKDPKRFLKLVKDPDASWNSGMVFAGPAIVYMHR